MTNSWPINLSYIVEYVPPLAYVQCTFVIILRLSPNTYDGVFLEKSFAMFHH